MPNLDKIREFAAGMSMQHRVVGGMLLVAILLAVVLLVRGASWGESSEYLFGGRQLSDRELDRFELAFAKAALNDFAREGRRIRVPKEQRAEYLAALQAESALPAELQSIVQDAIDAGSPWESQQQRRDRMRHAKEQKLGREIAKIPEVRSASVEHDTDETPGFGKTAKQSAVVIVTPEGGQSLSKGRMDQIRSLVRHAYASLNDDDISVIDVNSSHSPDAEDDPLLQRRLKVEAAYERKIRKQLAGYGRLNISVHAEIDPSMGTRTTSSKYDPEPTTTASYTRNIHMDRSPRLAGGVPGTANNVGRSGGPSLAPIGTALRQTRQEERGSNSVVGAQYTVEMSAPMPTKYVRAAISIPASYYKKVYAQRAAAAGQTVPESLD
ncbi:MAG: beta-cystathionase, partial [Planctomycetota bacterium]